MGAGLILKNFTNLPSSGTGQSEPTLVQRLEKLPGSSLLSQELPVWLLSGGKGGFLEVLEKQQVSGDGQDGGGGALRLLGTRTVFYLVLSKTKLQPYQHLLEISPERGQKVQAHLKLAFAYGISLDLPLCQSVYLSN